MEQELAALDASARRAEARRREVLRHADRWLSARACGDAAGTGAVERSDPALARRLRAFEGELAHLGGADKAQAFARLRDAVLVLRMTEVLHELVDEECPLCAAEGVGH